jgi:hypothetical protein
MISPSGEDLARGEQSMTGLGVSQRVRRREKWAS